MSEFTKDQIEGIFKVAKELVKTSGIISKRVKNAVKKVLYNSKNSKKSKVARGEALTQRGKK